LWRAARQSSIIDPSRGASGASGASGPAFAQAIRELVVSTWGGGKERDTLSNPQ